MWQLRAWHAKLREYPRQEKEVMFNPDTPPVRQPNSWSCSINTALWMLRAMGRDFTYDELAGMMVPRYVTPEQGLLLGDGSGLAYFLSNRGYRTGHRPATWAWLQTNAGAFPIGIGSPTMYHWVAVRGMTVDGSTLLLSNPAPGYLGVWDTMSYQQYLHFRPWAAVWIEGEDDMSDDCQAQLQALRHEVDTYVGGVQTVVQQGLGTIEGIIAGYPEEEQATFSEILAQCKAIREGTGFND